MALSSLSLWKDAFLQFLNSPTIISPALTNSNTTLALPSNVTVTFAWPNHRLWLDLVTFFIIWAMWLSMRPGERRGRTQRMQKVAGRRHVSGGAHSTTVPLWGAFYNLSQSGLGEGRLSKPEVRSHAIYLTELHYLYQLLDEWWGQTASTFWDSVFSFIEWKQ